MILDTDDYVNKKTRCNTPVGPLSDGVMPVTNSPWFTLTELDRDKILAGLPRIDLPEIRYWRYRWPRDFVAACNRLIKTKKVDLPGNPTIGCRVAAAIDSPVFDHPGVAGNVVTMEPYTDHRDALQTKTDLAKQLAADLGATLHVSESQWYPPRTTCYAFVMERGV